MWVNVGFINIYLIILNLTCLKLQTLNFKLFSIRKIYLFILIERDMNMQGQLNSKNILIVILLVILLFMMFLALNYVSLPKYNIMNSSLSNSSYPQGRIEKFTNFPTPFNLIQNGYFENGSNSANYINQSGYNKIVNVKNPGKTSFALEQKQTGTMTFYELMTDASQNSKYIFLTWFSARNEDSSPVEIEKIDVAKLISVRMKNDDFTNFYPQMSYSVIQKVVLNTDDSIWYLLKFTFSSNANIHERMTINVNNTDQLQAPFMYFTGLSLFRVLMDAENFIYNDKLICYTDGFHFEGTSKIWNDLSGNGNDLVWSEIPIVDSNQGFIESDNISCTGFATNLLTDTFTFSLVLEKSQKMIEDADNDITNNYETFQNKSSSQNAEKMILSIPGNERYAFEIEWVNDYIYLYTPFRKIKSKKQVALYNKSLLEFEYSKGQILIRVNGDEVLNEKVLKVSFNKNKWILNRNHNSEMNYYAVLVFTKQIELDESKDISNYFMKSMNKNFTTHDINNYYLDNNISYTGIQKEDYVQPYSDKSYTSSFEGNTLTGGGWSPGGDWQSKVGGRKGGNLKTDCKNQCENMCRGFLEDIDNPEFDEYSHCIQNCKNVIPSCNKFCKDDANKNTRYCYVKPGDDPESSCPKVYMKDGKYKIYIPPNSPYSERLKFSGDRNYGKDIKKVREIYRMNFPDCKLPKELQPYGGKSSLENCPFVVDEYNPCLSNICGGVDWNVKNVKDLHLNDKCKKAVSNYCYMNYEVDDMCYCWDPNNADKDECVKIRRYFENPKDMCKPNTYDIEEHPDFYKYIKKDNIPCWGCNVETEKPPYNES